MNRLGVLATAAILLWVATPVLAGVQAQLTTEYVKGKNGGHERLQGTLWQEGDRLRLDQGQEERVQSFLMDRHAARVYLVMHKEKTYFESQLTADIELHLLAAGIGILPRGEKRAWLRRGNRARYDGVNCQIYQGSTSVAGVPTELSVCLADEFAGLVLHSEAHDDRGRRVVTTLSHLVNTPQKRSLFVLPEEYSPRFLAPGAVQQGTLDKLREGDYKSSKIQ